MLVKSLQEVRLVREVEQVNKGKIKSSPKELNVIENKFEKPSLIKLKSIEDSGRRNKSKSSVSSKVSSSSVSTDGKNDQIEETKVDFDDNSSKSPSKAKKKSDFDSSSNVLPDINSQNNYTMKDIGGVANLGLQKSITSSSSSNNNKNNSDDNGLSVIREDEPRSKDGDTTNYNRSYKHQSNEKRAFMEQKSSSDNHNNIKPEQNKDDSSNTTGTQIKFNTSVKRVSHEESIEIKADLEYSDEKISGYTKNQSTEFFDEKPTNF